MNIVIKVLETGFDIYQKCNKSENNYIKYHFEHVKRKDINANLYRIIRAYGYVRTDKYEFKELFNGYPIVGNGEWEFAAREIDAEDFSGGFHGDENIIEVKLTADKKEIMLDTVNNIECNEAVFYQKSFVDRCNTPNDNIAVHEKLYTVSNGVINIKQNVEWLQSLLITASGMGMLPIVRDINGFQMTDTAVMLDGPNKNIECDVSTTESNTVISQFNKDITSVKVYGKKSGISIQIDNHTVPKLDSAEMHLQVRPWDHKIYFMVARNHTVNPKEKWTNDTTFTFNLDL